MFQVFVPKHLQKRLSGDIMDIADEIKSVVVFLGRENDLEGTLRDKHLVKILDYMITTETEQYQETLGKLAFKCGINQRYIKENYLVGMELFKIIQVYSNGGLKHWKWNGVPTTTAKKSGIKIAVNDKKMCLNCPVKTPNKDCIEMECKNVVEHITPKVEKNE